MDQGPLVIEEIEAGERLLREFDDYAPVRVAFWMRTSGEDERYLYIASDRIDATNFDLAYGEVLRIAQEIRSPYCDPFRVKVINSSKPPARAALEARRRFPADMAARLGGGSFGGVDVADVYIYPALAQAGMP